MRLLGLRPGASLGTHGGKEDDVAYALRARQVHEQPVEPDTHPAHRWHAVFHGAQVVLVHPAGLLVAGRTELGLRLESPPLVDGIVELAEGVGELASPREELEA